MEFSGGNVGMEGGTKVLGTLHPGECRFLALVFVLHVRRDKRSGIEVENFLLTPCPGSPRTALLARLDNIAGPS